MLAGLTDGLDGWLARKFQWQSKLGSMIDPVADKLLITVSFIVLGILQTLPWWLIILVISRDVIIFIGASFWYFFITRLIKFQPTLLSKFNTNVQLFLITICLVNLSFFIVPHKIIAFIMLLTTITTLLTFVDYVVTWGYRAWLSLLTRRN